MPQTQLTGQLKEKPTLRVRCLYSSFVHGTLHRLNMEVDLQTLFGLHVTWCAQLYSLAKTLQLPPPPHLDS